MKRGRLAPRLTITLSILMIVVSVVGFVVTMVLNAFVLDKYNAYGEVPIPGTSSLHLPAGEATVSFHTVVIGGPDGGLPVPKLGMTIVPPEGISDPVVTEDWGASTTVNNDSRVRVWVVQVPAEGTYDIVTDGEVNGYISPRLAFGHASSTGWLPWAFGGLFGVALAGLFGGIVWSGRVARRPQPIMTFHDTGFDAGAWSSGDAVPTSRPPAESYAPSDQGVRLEQLRQLAALRDSGALTESEFIDEKRRILDAD